MDHNHLLDVDELTNFLQPGPQGAEHVVAAEAQHAIESADRDRDGKMSSTEWGAHHIALMQAHGAGGAGDREDTCDAEFAFLDRDGDGFINATEARRLLAARHQTEMELRKLVKTADKDGDGAISEKEMTAAFRAFEKSHLFKNAFYTDEEESGDEEDITEEN